MTRKFLYLHVRILLDLQCEIEALEKGLSSMDDDDAKKQPFALKSREYDEGSHDGWPRRALLQEINEKLAKYRRCFITIRYLF